MSEPTLFTDNACPSPHSHQAREANRQAWEACELDLKDCQRFELVVTLYEHETAGIRPDTWPAPVRNLTERECEKWIKDHPDRVVRAVTFGTTKRIQQLACVLILHWSEKKT